MKHTTYYHNQPNKTIFTSIENILKNHTYPLTFYKGKKAHTNIIGNEKASALVVTRGLLLCEPRSVSS